MAKIMENESAAAALAVTKAPRVVAAAGSAPDLDKASAAAAE